MSNSLDMTNADYGQDGSGSQHQTAAHFLNTTTTVNRNKCLGNDINTQSNGIMPCRVSALQDSGGSMAAAAMRRGDGEGNGVLKGTIFRNIRQELKKGVQPARSLPRCIVTLMFRDIIQWRLIRAKVLELGVSKRQVLRDTGIHWCTLKKILKYPFPPTYRRNRPATPKMEDVVTDIENKVVESAVFIRDAIQSIPRSAMTFVELRRLARFLQDRGFAPIPSTKCHTFDSENHQWMRKVMQKKLSVAAIQRACGNHPELDNLVKMAWSGSFSERKKAIVVLSKLKGISLRSIHRFLNGSPHTIPRYWAKFQSGGVAMLFTRKSRPKQAENAAFQSAVFSLLHSPPSVHGINRTTWKWDDLLPCLRRQGFSTNKDTLRAVIKAAGYKWRKAKTVLTSTDPEYRQKLELIKSILTSLGENDRFCSIDEFGPFAVKMKGGKRLVAPNEYPHVPQFQKSKGCLIITAALELSRNQVTHFYSKAKNTTEMIKLLDMLLEKYKGCEKLYLSWDAASWHASKALYRKVESVNHPDYRQAARTPVVELVPLPKSAQFLNVIESVFSGMAKAIIHNSDYQSVEEAMTAIDRYFEERNNHYLMHPMRAGKKIWAKEPVVSEFSESNNCKNPKWR